MVGVAGPLSEPADVERYLERIGFAAPIRHDIDTLAALQLRHLQAVPFENLAVFCRRPVRVDDAWTFDKIVNRRRGGWCFELNGAFAQLLVALGFNVQRLAAAVLIDGPNDSVDHLVLEVMLDQAFLVEVGFGDNAPTSPLPLATRGPIATPAGAFQFLNSPRGSTLVQLVDGEPEPRYRFKRVNHRTDYFEPPSRRLQQDRTLHWSISPFATRLIGDDGTRLTLTRSSLKTQRGDEIERIPVAPDDWNDVLFANFGIIESLTTDQLAGRPK